MMNTTKRMIDKLKQYSFTNGRVRYLNGIQKVRCPCCDGVLYVEITDGEVLLHREKSIELSEDEVTKILKENNIEFG